MDRLSAPGVDTTKIEGKEMTNSGLENKLIGKCIKQTFLSENVIQLNFSDGDCLIGRCAKSDVIEWTFLEQTPSMRQLKKEMEEAIKILEKIKEK